MRSRGQRYEFYFYNSRISFLVFVGDATKLYKNGDAIKLGDAIKPNGSALFGTQKGCEGIKFAYSNNCQTAILTGIELLFYVWFTIVYMYV